jgi:hypothetical protein
LLLRFVGVSAWRWANDSILTRCISDYAAYINGQVINVDVGMSIGLTEAMVELISQ